MYLVNTELLQLEEFIGGTNVPAYAILSHTWEDQEVSFALFGEAEAKKMKGYNKITNACLQARADGYEYVWIDTCCIDKSSCAELSEAINSMYAWYRDARVCYAYLVDVDGELSPAPAHDEAATAKLYKGFPWKIGQSPHSRRHLRENPPHHGQFSHSRWFTRGWTLQELIAPREVVFFSRDWVEIARRNSSCDKLAWVTGIDSSYLCGDLPVSRASIAERMFWASNRTTTRPEDMAYCLLGVFDINMPLLYGEGGKAFLRLQEEIIKQSDDHTIFAWKSDQGLMHNYHSILAPHPRYFKHSRDFVPCASPDDDSSIVITSMGLEIKLRQVHANMDPRAVAYALNCTSNIGREGFTTIILQKLENSARLHARVYNDTLGHSLPECSHATVLLISGRTNVSSGLEMDISIPSGSLPPSANVYWMVARSVNPLFTGREDLLQELDSIIRNAITDRSSQVQCRIVLSGWGGIGKSEICLQLTKRLRNLFWGVFWVDVGASSTAESGFLNIAQHLSISAQSWKDVRLVLANLKQPWLLVLDNADDPAVNYQDYFPDGASGIVILTSRNRECELYGTVKSITLDQLSMEEAQHLLLRTAHVPPDRYDVHAEDASKVARNLQCHPLALILAGTYISRGHTTLAAYPLVFTQQRRRLLQHQPNLRKSRYGNIYTAFEASTHFLYSLSTQKTDDALQLLAVLATCAPNQLPLALFEAGWKGARSISFSIATDNSVFKLTPWHVSHLPSLMQVDVDQWDPFRLVEAIHTLEQVSLVSTDSRNGCLSVSMHPLVHAWAHYRQGLTEQHRSWVMTGCLMAIARDDHTLWQQHGRQLQPHVQAVAARNVSRIFSSLSSANIVSILMNCAQLLYDVRDDATLSNLMRTLFTHLRLDWQIVDRDWLDLYDLAALNLSNHGKIKEAISLQKQLLTIREMTLTEDHPDRLASQLTLARAYQSNGQVEQAVALLEHVVEVHEQLVPEKYSDMLSNMQPFFELLHVEDESEPARVLHQRILVLRDKRRKPEMPRTSLENHKDDSAPEDTESLSDATDVSSIGSTDSVPSLDSDSSSFYPSDMDKERAQTAGQHFASLLFEDSILKSLYSEAFAKLGLARFETNHDTLLKLYFKDLRQECQTSNHKDVVRTLRRKTQRNNVTSLIKKVFDSTQAVRDQTIAVLQEQKPDRKYRLEQYLSNLKIEQKDSSEEEAPYRIIDTGYDEEPIEEDESSDGSDMGDINPNLDRVTEFLTQGESFARFRSNLQYLLRPPRNLEDALNERDTHIVERFLTKNFQSTATNEYEWLWELDEVGYTRREIAQMLLEEARDSPWIVFTPQSGSTPLLPSDSHVADCRHTASSLTNSSIRNGSIPHVAAPISFHPDLLRSLQELLGLGGIAPTSQTSGDWNGTVRFTDKSSNSFISYHMDSDVDDPSQVTLRISKALTGFCRAATLAQSANICCDCFTVLTHAVGGQKAGTNCKGVLELRKVEFSMAVQFLEAVNAVTDAGDMFAINIRNCARYAQMLLGSLLEEQLPPLQESLHYCSLAAQFLCVGFLSYIRGHAGMIDPFFLDTTQQKIVLCGSIDLKKEISDSLAIECELAHLTCLSEMINQPVLAFRARVENSTPANVSQIRYDVSAMIDDLLDTWGPGCFVFNRSEPDKVLAIGIGGGYISQRSDMNSIFHWSQNMPQLNTGAVPFLPNTQLLIGAAVVVNPNCHIDEQHYRSKHCRFLQQLGTHEAFWSIVEKQIGVQAGQYASLIFNQTYKLTPAKSLKARYFQSGGWLHLSTGLDHTWGLQVSLCTGIARRVRLRNLLADLLPKFIDPTKRELWRRLEAQKVTEAFETGHLGDWLEKIDTELQDYLLVLVRSILGYLEETGVDHTGKHLVLAWPIQDDLQRCLKIPCEQQTRWARILTDSMECATFACVTSKCLVTDNVKCQGAASWANASRLLATAFSCASPLKDNEKYFVQKFDTLLLVRVEKPASGGTPHLIVKPSMIPSQIRKRIVEMERKKRSQMIRERQSHLDQAEDVIVRSN